MNDSANDVSSGNPTDVTSGASVEPKGDSTNTQSKDSVAYDTYRKVLSEKKRRDDEVATLREQVESLQSADKQRTETELKQKEDYKQLLELRDQELAEAKTQLGSLGKQRADASKLDAFLSALDGKVDKKFWHLVNLDKIVVDPESGNVDEMSVTKQVEDFRTSYPEIITVKGLSKMPSQSPRGAGSTDVGSLTGDQLSAKLGALLTQ